MTNIFSLVSSTPKTNYRFIFEVSSFVAKITPLGEKMARFVALLTESF